LRRSITSHTVWFNRTVEQLTPRQNTSSSIAAVRRPVFVFCCLN
jgi:hypothetical protein